MISSWLVWSMLLYCSQVDCLHSVPSSLALLKQGRLTLSAMHDTMVDGRQVRPTASKLGSTAAIFVYGIRRKLEQLPWIATASLTSSMGGSSSTVCNPAVRSCPLWESTVNSCSKYLPNEPSADALLTPVSACPNINLHLFDHSWQFTLTLPKY